MTFHFAHMAPPGADARRTPVSCWLRDARSGTLMQRWHRPVSQHPQIDAQLRALLTRQAKLRAG